MQRRFPALILGMLSLSMSAAQTPDPAAILTTGPLKADGTPSGLKAHVGVLVQDAQSGETLLALNDAEAFTPASSLKAITTAAALYALGPEYTFKTSLLAPAATGGRLERLTLRGLGDPTLHEKGEGNSLEALAQAVAAAGIRSVGELRIDDLAFGQARWGQGWMWDDTEYPVGALRLDNDDATYLRLVVDSDEAKAGIRPNPALLTDPSTLALAVGERFAALLKAKGVTVSGKMAHASAEKGDTTLAQVASVPLSNLIRQTNKPSNNIYAEQLRATLGLGEDGTPSSEERVGAATDLFLKTAGAAAGYRLRDGSGLSRYNLITPQQVLAVLRYAYLHPVGSALAPAEAFRAHANPYIESLPVAGTGETTPSAKELGGTLRNRLTNTGLDVRAKTGSMTGIASLSGYMVAKSGRILAFSLLMDNYAAGISDLNRWQDALLKALAAKY